VKVLAAMSGGVDSAVAAARAAEAGHEVVGVHLALARNPASLRTGARGCCTLEDARDARRAADAIGIPFYVWDLAERFDREVVAEFTAEYAAGRTPNPCVRCNERIKFSALLDKALALGFEAVCTGHYARLRPHPATGAPALHRAADAAKDQSYVLAVVPPGRLRHAMFPLGESSKDAVRAEASRRGLQVAAKPDSHDICFVADGDTRAWLTARLGRRRGPVVEPGGAVVGEHEGAYAFTVGQRRGLRLGRPAGDGRARYVLEVRPVTNTVVVGPREALSVTRLSGRPAVWCGPPPSVGERVGVQVRAHGEEVPGRVEALHPAAGGPGSADGGPAVPDGAPAVPQAVWVVLERPLTGVAPGQTMALYGGTRVIGAATLAPPAAADRFAWTGRASLGWHDREDGRSPDAGGGDRCQGPDGQPGLPDRAGAARPGAGSPDRPG
jgi:tRNA-specific 2-thiouridylase